MQTLNKPQIHFAKRWPTVSCRHTRQSVYKTVFTKDLIIAKRIKVGFKRVQTFPINSRKHFLVLRTFSLPSVYRCNATEDHKATPQQNIKSTLADVQNYVRNRERKCADTTGTVLVPWAGHFQC